MLQGLPDKEKGMEILVCANSHISKQLEGVEEGEFQIGSQGGSLG